MLLWTVDISSHRAVCDKARRIPLARTGLLPISFFWFLDLVLNSLPLERVDITYRGLVPKCETRQSATEYGSSTYLIHGLDYVDSS